MYSAILSAYGIETDGNLESVEAHVADLRERGSCDVVGICDKNDPDFRSSTEEDVETGKLREFVYQYQNGGYVGDNYAGYTFLRLGEHAYLKFRYEM